jgi:hypothetical protein
MQPNLSALLFVGTQLAPGFHYTESDCVKWYIFQEVGTQLLIAGVESILILRGMLYTIFILQLYSTAHLPQVHALYDRNRYVTLPLIVLFLAENVAMTNALIIVVPGVRFDASCTVTRSPSTLVIFAYDNVFSLTFLRLLIRRLNFVIVPPSFYSKQSSFSSHLPNS